MKEGRQLSNMEKEGNCWWCKTLCKISLKKNVYNGKGYGDTSVETCKLATEGIGLW